MCLEMNMRGKKFAKVKNCNLIHATMDEPHTSPGNQGSSAPGPQTATGPWPVRNWAAQQEVNSE